MNLMKTRAKTASLVVASALAVSCLSVSASAAIISNPGFLFTTAGHVNGDTGHAINISTLNVPNWQPATTAGGFSPNVTDPQAIFANNPNEYMQIQIQSPGGSQDSYQQIVIPATGTYLLSMDADRRSDNVNTSGTMILQLWAGNVSSFSSGSPITPDAQVSPALTGSFQQYSRTYNSLAAGSYTVRVGGTYSSGSFFQAGIDNVDISAVPEPGTYALLASAAGMLLLWRKKQQAV